MKMIKEYSAPVAMIVSMDQADIVCTSNPQTPWIPLTVGEEEGETYANPNPNV